MLIALEGTDMNTGLSQLRGDAEAEALHVGVPGRPVAGGETAEHAVGSQWSLCHKWRLYVFQGQTTNSTGGGEGQHVQAVPITSHSNIECQHVERAKKGGGRTLSSTSKQYPLFA